MVQNMILVWVTFQRLFAMDWGRILRLGLVGPDAVHLQKPWFKAVTQPSYPVSHLKNYFLNLNLTQDLKSDIRIAWLCSDELTWTESDHVRATNAVLKRDNEDNKKRLEPLPLLLAMFTATFIPSSHALGNSLLSASDEVEGLSIYNFGMLGAIRAKAASGFVDIAPKSTLKLVFSEMVEAQNVSSRALKDYANALADLGELDRCASLKARYRFAQFFEAIEPDVAGATEFLDLSMKDVRGSAARCLSVYLEFFSARFILQIAGASEGSDQIGPEQIVESIRLISAPEANEVASACRAVALLSMYDKDPDFEWISNELFSAFLLGSNNSAGDLIVLSQMGVVEALEALKSDVPNSLLPAVKELCLRTSDASACRSPISAQTRRSGFSVRDFVNVRFSKPYLADW